uniref:NADH-ubiquinone oxidoreductase chain 6 n=1 Tax=Strigamia maritima TaxID=126957 RepID=A0A0C5APN5_STRMM|nr:NADH dehydrogenase subunit 6 [Strigamia maritima]AJK90875.1 NADH dehydrogenase subunit 6 [Strigamia maritima]
MNQIMTSTLMTSAMTTMFMSHPVAITISIIAQTIMTALMISIMYQTPWFSYILFLIFLGGMLILFSYITSLTANMTFKANTAPMVAPPAIMLWLLLTINLKADTINNQSTQLMINKLFHQDMKTTMILALFLLIILLIAVKITTAHKGPLQSKT